MKKIEIIPIAWKKLQRRGIPEEWVRETIKFPAQIVEGYEGRKVAHKKYLIEGKEYLLRVVYEEKKEMIEILTAYLTSQVDRYWEGEENED
jgi:hypothetical protein